jgi:hypothetical protein
VEDRAATGGLFGLLLVTAAAEAGRFGTGREGGWLADGVRVGDVGAAARRNFDWQAGH